MKKNISVQVLIIALSLLLCACGNEPVKSVLEQNNMRGTIRTVTETAYLPSSSDTLAFGYRMVFRYDTLGNQTSGTSYDVSDSVISRAVYTYSGNLRDVTGTVYNSSGKISAVYRNRYGRNGRLESSSVCLPDGTPDVVYRYEYDSEGHLSAVYGYDGDKTVISKDVYTGGTPPLTQEHYGPDGILSVRYGFSHDSLGNDTSLSILDGGSNDTVNVIRYSYRYDANGNWIEKISASGDDTVSVVRRSIEYYVE